MKKKYNNEYIDNQLIGREIKRLTDCNSALQKCQWICLKCNYTWYNSPSKIIGCNQGCRRCAGLIKITVQDIDQYLEKKSITRLEDFTKLNNKITLKCLIESCNFIWSINGKSLINKTSCPKCAKVARLSNEIIDARLIGRPIQRIGDYCNAKTKLQLKCLIDTCNFVWFATTDNLFSNNRGCPKCSNTLRLTNEIIDERLENFDRQIKRIGNYKSIHSKIEWVCLKDNFIWEASANEVVNHYTGCPACPHKNQNILFNEIQKLKINFQFQKDIREINKNEVKKYLIDFYLPDHNLCIEYNGAQHYGPVRFGGISIIEAEKNFTKQKNRDEYVRLFCKNNNIHLIEIDGRLFQRNKLINYVRDDIAPLLRCNVG